MTKWTKMLAALGGAAAALGVTPAFAAGTDANTLISNTANVTYSVGSVAQPAVNSNTDTFRVDKIAKVTVVGGSTTSVAPSQAGAILTYTVTNNSNAPMDIALTAVEPTSDNFNVASYEIRVESGANAGYQPAEDLVAPAYLDEVAEDATRTVYIVSTMPGGIVTGNLAQVDLVAQLHQGGGAGTQGTIVNATNNPTGAVNGVGTVETVMDDIAGTAAGDIIRDGEHSARGTYSVNTAAITVAKTSRVVSDPINGTTNPKAIPGAVIEYCIAVTNAAGGAAASSITITDGFNATYAPAAANSLQGNVTYVAGSARIGATVAGGVCTGGAAAGTTYAAGPPASVSATVATLAAGSTTGMSFQVTITP